jgi:transposase
VRFALLAAAGEHTLEELATQVGRQRSTLQNWLTKFKAGGLGGLLDRDASPGLTSPLARGKLQQQLRSGLKQRRWTSAEDVATWLREVHGIHRSRKSIYYWFAKWGTPAPGASPASNQ